MPTNNHKAPGVYIEPGVCVTGLNAGVSCASIPGDRPLLCQGRVPLNRNQPCVRPLAQDPRLRRYQASNSAITSRGEGGSDAVGPRPDYEWRWCRERLTTNTPPPSVRSFIPSDPVASHVRISHEDLGPTVGIFSINHGAAKLINWPGLLLAGHLRCKAGGGERQSDASMAAISVSCIAMPDGWEGELRVLTSCNT